jgi:clan AA aspartic protease
LLEGYVDESRQPRVALLVVGQRGQFLEVDAVIDTGFDGAVCLPESFAAQVALQLLGTQLVELADGSQHEEQVYLGQILFDGERHWVDISLTQATDALLGTALLQEYRLEIGFRSRTVTLRKEAGG